MKFTLEIELGNDAMRTGNDVAHVLNVLRQYFDINDGVIEAIYPHGIRDTDGNTVGTWGVTD